MEEACVGLCVGFTNKLRDGLLELAVGAKEICLYQPCNH